MDVQYPIYIFSRSFAKSEASEPPVPGRTSRRAGRWANGCGGTRERVNVVESVERDSSVTAMSAAASSRSSVSSDGSRTIS